jgi:hypothetical protein
MPVRLDPLAEADLDRVSRPDFARVRHALAALGTAAAGLDVAPLEGHEPWQVLVVEGHWIVFRTLPEGDQYVARIVTRRELARIVEDLR